MKTVEEEEAGGSTRAPQFHVVAIGASAGGLQALEELFQSMSPDVRAAYVVLQHLSPNFESKMDELLRRQTNIPVKNITDGMKCEPNAIYLPPANSDVIISSGRFLLSDRPREEVFRLPIDHFFRSLASDVGRCAVGVILSGTGSDGSRGIGEIHEAGGLVIAQTTDSARFDGMPRNARATGMVDLVLSPSEIADSLADYIGHYVATGGEYPVGETTDGDRVNEIVQLLKDRFGIDFFEYKETTVARRIWRRVALSRAVDIDDYVERIRDDEQEVRAIFQDLLIGVTQFFRDPDAFDFLREEVVPSVVQNADADRGIRVWVPACTTGEEVYSLGIMFLEAIDAHRPGIGLKIFATDVDENALASANKAVYTSEMLADIPAEYRGKYFRGDADGFHRVDKRLRESVVFARHDILVDPPFTGLDFLSCRNLLIYLKPQAQKKVLTLFHFALKRDGVLFLGSSETPGALADEFESVSSKHRVFRKSRDVRLSPEPRLYQTRSPDAFARLPGSGSTFKESRLLPVYERLVGRYIPPSFLVDKQRTLVHAFSGAEALLHFRGGRMSTDILDLVHPDLRMAVAGALRQADREGGEARYAGVGLTRGDGENVAYDVTAAPVTVSRSEIYYLLTLEENMSAHRPVTTVVDADPDDLNREYIESIESELRYTQENLQATVEELETSNEELQATNEELVASNEELQSTNEELHSVNEELYTVNSEYQAKIEELTRLTADLDNLFESIDMAVVFLDEELRIRKFTNQAAPVFNLIPQDVGRKFGTFSMKIDYDDIADDLERVLESGQPIAHEVADDRGRWHQLRVLPYLTSNRDVAGIVVTLGDVSQLKKALERVEQGVRQRDIFLAMLSHELRNPLMALLTASRIFLDDDSTEDEKGNAADVVRRQTLHMARLLDDLLDVSRMRQDKVELRREVFDLREIVQDVKAEVAEIDRGGVEFDIDVDDEPLWVDADKTRLRQLMANLLTNAFKFSGGVGAVRFSIAAGEDGNDAVITVSDDGQGLAPYMLDSIFDPFVQHSASSESSAEVGLGLGLAMVDAVARAHGGNVSARSDGLGKGAAFEARIPMYRGEVQVEEVPEDVEIEGARRVLFVEDQEDTRELMQLALRSVGYEVTAVGTGTDAINKMKADDFDIGVIDIGLPDMTGLDVARAARDIHGPKMRLLAVTGHGRQKDRDRIMSAGFDRHLIKPIELDHLIAEIESKS